MGRELIQLVKNEEITPETIVENEEGKSVPAKNVKGLTFPGSQTETIPPIADSNTALANVTPSPFVLPPQTSVPVVNAGSVFAKDFRCNGCGTPLQIPKNSRGIVRCPACKTECVLEGLVKNAEIAAKENINSGIPLTATPAALHKLFLSLLAESPYIPLDIFDKLEIVREERHCVPAYQFYCSGSASYTYQVGRRETRQEQGYKKGILDDETYHVIKTIEEVKWTPMSNSAAVSELIYAPGSKKMALPIQKLYVGLDSKTITAKLVDIEELDYPANVETHSFNLPRPAAFDEYTKPRVEAILEQNAKRSLGGFDLLKDFSMGGGNLQNEAVRVFLGLYRLVYTYGGKEYSMWASGGGGTGWLEDVPIDLVRKVIYDEKLAKASVEPSTAGGCGCMSMIGAGLGVVGLLIAMNGTSDAASGSILILLLAALCFLPMILGIISAKKLNEQLEADKADFKAFDAQRQEVVQRFINSRKSCAGIYS